MNILVAKPIQVPASDFCWEQHPPFRICSHFDNEGGHPVCTENLGSLKYQHDGSVKKCLNCRNLQVIE